VWRRELDGLRRTVGAIDEGLRHTRIMPGLPGPVIAGALPNPAAASHRRNSGRRDSGLQARLVGP
jgi:hypothetical protein